MREKDFGLIQLGGGAFLPTYVRTFYILHVKLSICEWVWVCAADTIHRQTDRRKDVSKVGQKLGTNRGTFFEYLPLVV